MIMFLAEGGGMTPPPAQNNFGDTLSDGVAGPTALLIIVLLAIGTVLLIRNMNGHLKRLPERFPVPVGAATGDPATGEAGAGGGAAPAAGAASPEGGAETGAPPRAGGDAA